MKIYRFSSAIWSISFVVSTSFHHKHSFFDGQQHISTASHERFFTTFHSFVRKIYTFMSENNCRFGSLIVSSQFQVTPRKEIWSSLFGITQLMGTNLSRTGDWFEKLWETSHKFLEKCSKIFDYFLSWTF